MKNDVSKIKSSPNVLVSADKTTNFYEIWPNNYKKLLHENITKTYKKATNHLEHAIKLKAKHIAKNIILDDRVKSLDKTPAHPFRLITHAN